jgi:hypothetical protein
MIKTLMSIYLAAMLLAACAVMGTSPESQITRGAQTHTAATNLTAALLQRNKITLEQAKQYRAMLGTASAALDGSAQTLQACRVINGPPAAAPDPCQQNISTDTALALAILTEIEKTLQAQAAK